MKKSILKVLNNMIIFLDGDIETEEIEMQEIRNLYLEYKIEKLQELADEKLNSIDQKKSYKNALIKMSLKLTESEGK